MTSKLQLNVFDFFSLFFRALLSGDYVAAKNTTSLLFFGWLLFNVRQVDGNERTDWLNVLRKSSRLLLLLLLLL